MNKAQTSVHNPDRLAASQGFISSHWKDTSAGAEAHCNDTDKTVFYGTHAHSRQMIDYIKLKGKTVAKGICKHTTCHAVVCGNFWYKPKKGPCEVAKRSDEKSKQRCVRVWSGSTTGQSYSDTGVMFHVGNTGHCYE
jgi:hypothetical protein